MAEYTATINPPRGRGTREEPDPVRIVKRYERLVGQRGTVDVNQQELAEYILPQASDITIKRSAGQERTERVWDSTAIHANELLASSIQGSLMSPAIRWFSLTLRNQQAEAQSKPVMDWLEQVTDRMYQALRQSNFNQEVGELCLDIGALGIGAIFMEEKPAREPGQFGGFRFQTLAPGTYVIAEDFEGRVDTLMRCYKMRAETIEQQFGREKTALPEPVQRALDAGRLDDEFEIIHAVYPRRDANSRRKGAKYKPWASCYIDRRTKTLLSEGGYDEFCYCVPRWAKTSSDPYGYGPGHTSRNDIRVLSRAKELTLSAGSKAIDPPGLVNSDAVFGELDLRSGAQTTVDGDPAKAWMPLESGAKFDVSQLLTGDLRQSIQHIFFWEQLQLQGDRPMTATEVERRLEIMRRVLGPVLGRFESEMLQPMLHRCFGIMLRANALPAIPQELSNQDLDIEYEGPLARSQKASRLAASDEVMQKIVVLGQISPEKALAALENFDIDNWIRDQAKIAGLPSENLRDPDTVQEERQAREQAQAQQAQLNRGLMVADAAGKAAPMLTALQGGATNGSGQPAPSMDNNPLLKMLTGGGAPAR